MLMFRGFKYPFARTLNKLQIEITGIEDQLFNVDKQNESDIANYILDKDGRWPEKERLENELKDKLKEYGKRPTIMTRLERNVAEKWARQAFQNLFGDASFRKSSEAQPQIILRLDMGQ